MSIETLYASADAEVSTFKTIAVDWVKTHQVPLILAAALVVFVVEWAVK